MRGTSEEWNLLTSFHKSAAVRVVTIRHPPSAIEGITSDHSVVGTVYDLPAHLAMLMIAVGWVRSDTRSRHRRRQPEPTPSFDRRREVDRRMRA